MEDPVEEWVFFVIAKMQEYAVPLLTGVFLSLICANAAPTAYFYYFNDGVILATDDHADTSVNHVPSGAGHRQLAAVEGAALYTMPFCTKQDSLILGHPFSLKFIANDMIMVFFFVSAHSIQLNNIYNLTLKICRRTPPSA